MRNSEDDNLRRPFEEADAWIVLGNFDEAARILHGLPPILKSTVEFCRSWIRIYVETKAWSNVEFMVATLLQHAPYDEFAILTQAEAFHKQGRSQEAFSALQFAPIQFRRGALYFYALARYLCALEQIGMASACLGQACKSDPELRSKALNDPELEKVWINRRR